jgi:hypothetical protein
MSANHMYETAYEKSLREATERKPEKWGHGAHVYPAAPAFKTALAKHVETWLNNPNMISRTTG